MTDAPLCVVVIITSFTRLIGSRPAPVQIPTRYVIGVVVACGAPALGVTLLATHLTLSVRPRLSFDSQRGLTLTGSFISDRYRLYLVRITAIDNASIRQLFEISKRRIVK